MEAKMLKFISRGKVFIFSKSDCTNCDESKKILGDLSINFASAEIDLSNEFTNEFKNHLDKNSGIKNYPKIYIGLKCIGDNLELKKLLESMKLFELLKNENISDYKILSLTKEMINEFFVMDTNRHKLAKCPKDAYLFFHNQNDVIEFDPKNLQKITRRIFEGGQEYNSYEKQMLNELFSQMEKFNKNSKKRKISKPNYWEDHDTLRFLQAAAYNSEKAIDILIEHFEWRCLNLPAEINNKAMQILNTGFLYIHGRDHKFRPVIHIKPSVITKYQKFFDFNDWNLATIYLLEYAINNLFLPGQIENWVIICDLKDCSVTSLPNDFKKILGILQNNYRCRLFRMFIINVGSFFNMMWGMIKKIIDSNTEKKIKILKSGNFKEIFEIINPSQIEVKYNGTSEDINSYFFPPIFPSSKYLLESEKEELILLSEKEYINKIKDNPKLKKSNFINIDNYNNNNIIDKDKDKDISNKKSDLEKKKSIFYQDNKNYNNNNIDVSIQDYGKGILIIKYIKIN
jgi:glutaredoxin